VAAGASDDGFVNASSGAGEAVSPCTKSVMGVNATLKPTPRIQTSGLLHFNREAYLDRANGIGVDVCNNQRYENVNPMLEPPTYFPDAYALRFIENASIGNYTYSSDLFEKGITYCVANIYFKNDTFNQSEGFRYWAIGKDCCPKTGLAGINQTTHFECGNASDPAARWGVMPTNKIMVDRFTTLAGLAEHMHDLPPAVSDHGAKIMYWTNDPDAAVPEWMHLPGMTPPVCSAPLLCIVPVVGKPLQMDPFLMEYMSPLPGPYYYAVGRGCCSSDRLQAGFTCGEMPGARSGAVLTTVGGRTEWQPALRKLAAVFHVNSNMSTAIYLWWDTPSNAQWECSRSQHPWLQAEKPAFSAPPKLSCEPSTGIPCQKDSGCTATGLACHGAMGHCVCRKGCWNSTMQTCAQWRDH